MARCPGAALWAWACLAAATLLHAGGLAHADCWLIEGDKGFVWLAICSQNQPPYEAIPQHINSTVVDLRLNENRIHGLPQAALSRFGNLTYLNLTKNEIAYIEDGAFSGQLNLQVLQLGYNRLRNLTEGALRGLGRLEYLYLQANRIEVVTPGAFGGCPNVLNIDLSMNRIQRLHGATFAGLARLSACELYSNPFFCSCELLGFLRWLAAFANATQTHDRVQCEAPPPYAGYFLLGRGHGQRGILGTLQAVCTDGAYGAEDPPAPEPRPAPGLGPPPPPPPPPEPSEAPCAAEDCFSGDGTTPLAALPTLPPRAEARPLLRVKQLTGDSATLMVQLPSPFTRVYTLEHFHLGRPSTVYRLTRPLQEVRLPGLAVLTNYTYCVVSASSGQLHNHTCLTLCLPPPPSPPSPGPRPATATHYIMTVLGCLFGMVLVLGAVYYGLRRRRRGEKHRAAAAAGGLTKTILELRYGPEAEVPGLAPLSQGPLLGPEPPARLPFVPAAAGEAEPYKPAESETPKASKGSYLEVRTGEPPRQGSATEISTITKEVDKVNQIINNCIDALKAEAAAEPQLVLLAEPLAGKHGFLSPAYQDPFGHGPQRHHGAEGAPRTSTSSSSSSRSPRAFGAEAAGAHKAAASEAKYIEKSSPAADAILTVTPEAAVLRAEAEKGRPYSEHRHSYPGPRPAEPPSPPAPLPPEGPSGRKASILEPLTRARPRDPAYSQLSPRQCRPLRPASPRPAAACRAAHSVWERLRLSRRPRRDREECVAAGHALRRKVQFAQDEDLHDILDYWKGVSAQHKS
ncbi:protein ELFN1 [Pipistrellus kuhlii]|uniref:Extracellular leucine rich repeat and fibronectin type III domain containing 1 n=1 Tax=Pipistrellus kuhlii TaxID=59472 RepID=A0A7J7XAM1_PIPKU|nr:protein ELFN1 [Pipistrellus kuhlii]KAF6346446.1 extracellular leucine rich repeat and fibronectin type III domain containing 1 [Pipistrellus kuhlii]